MLEKEQILHVQDIDTGGESDVHSEKGIELNQAREHEASNDLTQKQVQNFLQDDTIDLDLAQIIHAQNEPYPHLTNKELVDTLDNSGIQAVDSLIQGAAALEERQVTIDQDMFFLQSGDRRSWGERLVDRASQMQKFIGSWDYLSAKHGLVDNQIPIPGKDGLQYRVVDRMVNMEMRTEIEVDDPKAARRLGAGHLYNVLDSGNKELTITEVQKQTDATSVSKELVDRNQDKIIELIEGDDTKNNTMVIPPEYLRAFPHISQNEMRLNQAAEARGFDPMILNRLAYHEVKDKQSFRSEELLRDVQQKHNGAKIEHIAIAQVSDGMEVETVKIIDPKRSRWMTPDLALSEYGIGAVVATELGNKIKTLPLNEQQQMFSFLQNYYKVPLRSAEIKNWQNLQGVFPKNEKQLNRIIQRELQIASLHPTVPARILGEALVEATTMYMEDSPYQRTLLQGIKDTGVFANYKGDMYRGVAGMLGIDIAPFNIYEQDPDKREFAHQELSLLLYQYGLESETYKKIFGAYSIPKKIATPVAEE